jgi:MFS family permease
MNLRSYLRLPPGLSPELRSNFIRLFWDIAWWGFYIGSTASFLAIYATRCGATPEQIGLLTAIPAVLSLLLSLPVGWLLSHIPAGRATVLSALAGRSLFLVYALLPWLMPPRLQVEGLFIMAILLTVPNTVIGISFGQFFVEAIPREWRGTVVGARNAIMAIISFPVTLLCGQILSRMPFPQGYQVVFFIGFLGAVLTVFELRRVHPVADPALPPVQPSLAQTQRLLPAVNAEARVYLKVIGILFFFNITNNMVAPLIPDLLVNQLQLTDALISLGTAISTLLVFLVSLRIAWLTRRIGNRRATAIGAGLLALQTIALVIANGSALYILAAVIGGIASGVLGSAQYNYHLDSLPQTERPSWLSWSMLLGNTAVLLGALIGPAISSLIGADWALISFAVLRLGVGLVLLWEKPGRASLQATG